MRVRAMGIAAAVLVLLTACGDDEPATSVGTAEVVAPGSSTGDAIDDTTTAPADAAPGSGGSGSDDTAATDDRPGGTAAVATSDSGSTGASGGGGELVGTWEMQRQTFDLDADYTLDPEELDAATPPQYGIRRIEIRSGGECSFADDKEQVDGTCRVGPCVELSFAPEDCDVLEPTGGRMIDLRAEPGMAMLTGGVYGLLELSADRLVIKDVTGDMGTIYVYEPA